MTGPERFRRIEALFQGALELRPPARAAWLEEQCAGDEALRSELERLLLNDERAGELVERFELYFPDDHDPMLGTVLGPWRLVERVAEGGMGVIYRGERVDGLFDQRVAVKLLRHRAFADGLQRFRAECRTLARLEHPNIARVIDGGATENGTPYLVMEYVDGLPIDVHCRAERMSLAARLQLFATVCDVVDFAHRNLVVHRDLKPTNVLVDRQGAPKLLDFGIAQLVGASPTRPTAPSARLLTPEYASPEQLEGRAVTTTSDVYSLGVILYELLTACRPHVWSPEHTSGAWERVVAETEPLRPSALVSRRAIQRDPDVAAFAGEVGCSPAALRRHLRGDLDRVVLMALRKEPERRYQSAQALATDVRRLVSGLPVQARENTMPYRAWRFVRRHRWSVAAALAVGAALCATSVATWIGQRRAESAAAEAQLEKSRAESARRRAEVAAATAQRERGRAERAAEHARTEAHSFGLIADFLSETLLAEIPVAVPPERLRRRIARQAERARRQHIDEPHLRANLLDALGRLAVRTTMWDVAEELLQEAENIRVREFGTESLEAALSLSSRGMLRYEMGDYQTAAGVLAEALRLHREQPVGVHTDVAGVANDLAAVLRNLGRVDEARALHEEALARRRQGGDGGLPVAESLNNLACVLLDAGATDEAGQCAAEALAIRRRILGPGHRLTLQALMTRAGAEWLGGDLERAESLLRKAEAGHRALGRDGIDGLTVAISNLAQVNLERGDLDAAALLSDEALRLSSERLGSDHPHIADQLVRSATIAMRAGRREAATEAWDDALRIRRRAFPPGHREVVVLLFAYGDHLVRSGELATAEELLREAQAMLDGSGLQDEELLARTELALGVCLGQRGEDAEARAALEHALHRFEALHGVDSPQAKSARRQIGLLRQ